MKTKEDVIQELRKLEAGGHSMKISDFSNPLKNGIRKHFGGYKAAKAELGIESTHAAWSYSPGEMKTKLSELHAKGLTSKDVREKHPKLYKSICYYAGGLRSACDTFGVPKFPYPSREGQGTLYTVEDISDALRKVNDNGVVPSSRELKRTGYRWLVDAVKLRYGTWLNGLETYGYDPYEHTHGNTVYADYGLKFEYVLGGILEDLNVPYRKYEHERWNPDFVLSGNHWVDAKLSHWTEYGEMLQRYMPCCDKLTVVYMRGPVKDEVIKGEHPHRKVSVYKLIEGLNETKRKHYEDKLSEIEAQLNAA